MQTTYLIFLAKLIGKDIEDFILWRLKEEKRMKVKELKNGQREQFTVFLRSITQRESRNGAYCEMEIKPKEEEVLTVRMWSVDKDALLSIVSEMSPVKMQLKADEYAGRISYIATKVEPAPDCKDVSIFAEHANQSSETMFTSLAALLSKYGKDHGKIGLKLIQEENERLYRAAGAKTIHHNYYGGLLQHLLNVTRICTATASYVETKEFLSVRSKTARQVLQKIFEYWKSETGPYADLVKGVFNSALRACHLSEDARIKLIAMRLAEKLLPIYHEYMDEQVLNKNLVMAAISLRSVSVLSNSPMADIIGVGPADCLIVKPFVNEDTDMILHCLISSNEGEKKPAFAEAYAADQLIEMARNLYTLLQCEEDEEVVQTKLNQTKENLSQVIVAAAVHDIGKLDELDTDALGVADYTLDGALYGHTMISIDKVLAKAKELEIDLSSISVLLSCIASHHGKQEWGAFVEAETFEQKLLHQADMMDSRMEIYLRAERKLEIGDADDQMRRFVGNLIYRPGKKRTLEAK